MGGRAFNSSKLGNLRTPRIPDHIHKRLVSQFKAILSGFYARVESSPDAPEKIEHGDIDILVEGPLKPSSSIKELQSALGAVTYIDSPPTAYFAIWDSQLEAYAQLDVHICRQDGIEWECFHRAYGDLWNILRVMGKPFGVSVNDTGIQISATSIENRNGKASSMLFLTASPQEAIEFFGYDWGRYQGGFQTVEELFAFCAQCRFIQYEETIWGLVGQRVEGKWQERRPLCRRWLTEYLPSLIANEDQNKNTIPHPKITREAVLEEALIRFNKWDEYHCLIAGWNKDNFDKEMWGRIGGLLPIEKKGLGHILRPLRRRLEKEDETTGEKGFRAQEAEWRHFRENKWTDIALSEWKTLLELGLAETGVRRLEGIQKSKKIRGL